MNLFDVLIIFILGLGLTRGILRGLISELTSIIGILLAFYIANIHYFTLANKLPNWIKTQPYASIISFLFIFSLTTLVVNTLAIIIRYLMAIPPMGWTSRIFGGIFGLIKSNLVIVILLIVLTAFLPEKNNFIGNSHLSLYVFRISEIAANITHSNIKLDFFSNAKELKSYWKKNEIK